MNKKEFIEKYVENNSSLGNLLSGLLNAYNGEVVSPAIREAFIDGFYAFEEIDRGHDPSEHPEVIEREADQYIKDLNLW